MANFDSTKDVTLAEVKDRKEDGSGLYAGVYQYNGGTPKIGFKRTYIDKFGQEQGAKLGRLTRDEASWLDSELTDLITFIDKIR